MKVLHVNHSDINGGAARAAYRIHHALRDSGVDSTMVVNVAAAGDWTVEGPSGKVNKGVIARVRPRIRNLLLKTLRTQNPIIHSLAILPSNWVERINASDAHVVHLHWIGEMLSIADISRIKKPIIWTLHDMWAFCGAEHYTEDNRWQEGYHASNRPSHESGFDLNRWTWQRKRKHWKAPFQIVTPSQWLGDCVSKSALMPDWPVKVVPNPIDTQSWQPINQSLARQLYHLPQNVSLLLFGAMGGGQDPRKGFDLLLTALGHLHQASKLELVVFGQREPKQPIESGFTVHYVGHLHDNLSLQLLYSSVDAMIIPSRQDNLPNTGIEAQACGTPVVAFNVGGLPDIVDHQKTGYLATPFNTHDLAAGIQWVLAQRETGDLGQQVRKHAVAKFSAPVVAEQYRAVYAQIISST